MNKEHKKKDKKKKKDIADKQDKIELLRSESEGFGTISEGYRSSGQQDKEEESKEKEWIDTEDQ